MTGLLSNWRSRENCPPFNDEDFFGQIYVFEPTSFEFSPGDRAQIVDIVEYVNKVISDPCLGAQYFNPDINKAKPRSTSCVGAYFGQSKFSEEKKIQMICTDEVKEEEITDRLFKLAIKTLNSNGVGDNIIERFTRSMISITSLGTNKIEGNVQCILCKRRDRITVQSKITGNPPKIYWTMSNFARHIKNVHVKKFKAIVSKQFEDGSDSLVWQDNDDYIGSSSTFENLDAGNDDSVFYADPDVSNQNHSTILKYGMPDEHPPDLNELEKLIYEQISTQILHMSNSAMKYCEKVIDMKFKIKNEMYTVQCVSIAPDGNCLLGASMHQLTKHKVSSRIHDKGTNQIRADIVNLIKNHREDFQMDLLSTAIDEFGENEVNANSHLACTKFLERVLPKSGTWCGIESLRAITKMKKINILIINDSGDAYFPLGFDARLKQTAILAYTNMSVELHEVTGIEDDDESGDIVAKVQNISKMDRNHYNSIVRMEQHDIYILSKSLAIQTLNKANMPEQIDLSERFEPTKNLVKSE